LSPELVLLQIKPGPSEDQPPLVVEEFLSSLHAHKDSAQLTLIIANVQGVVSFFVRVPDHLRDTTERAFYAAYSGAEVLEAEERLIEPNLAHIGFGRHLRLRRSAALPIKRHPQLLDAASRQIIDPLNGVLAAIKMPVESDVAVRVDIQLSPHSDAYRSRATEALLKLKAREFQRAERRTEAYLQLALLPWWLRYTCAAPLLSALRHSIPLPLDEGALRNLKADEAAASHDRESDLQACISKLQKHLFDASLRLSVTAPTRKLAQQHLRALGAAFAQFDLPNLNGFATVNKPRRCILNTEELATLWHLPQIDKADPDIDANAHRRLAPPRVLPEEQPGVPLTIIGQTTYRGQNRAVGVLLPDRRRHVWAIGKTGVGKSTLIENMLLSDIRCGLGVGLLDPHGDLVISVLKKIPPDRERDVVLLDPSDEEHPVAFNPLATGISSPRRIADELLSILKLLFATGPHASWQSTNLLRFNQRWWNLMADQYPSG